MSARSGARASTARPSMALRDCGTVYRWRLVRTPVATSITRDGRASRLENHKIR